MSAHDPKRTFAPAPFSGLALFVAASASDGALFAKSQRRNITSDSIEGLAPRQRLLYLEAPVWAIAPGLLLLGNWIRPVGLSYERPPSLLPGYFAGRASERPWTLRRGFFFAELISELRVAFLGGGSASCIPRRAPVMQPNLRLFGY